MVTHAAYELKKMVTNLQLEEKKTMAW